MHNYKPDFLLRTIRSAVHAAGDVFGSIRQERMFFLTAYEDALIVRAANRDQEQVIAEKPFFPTEVWRETACRIRETRRIGPGER